MSSNILFSSNCVLSEFDIPNDFLSREDLKNFSIAESARLIQCASYKGVNLFLLDMSTNSATGTFKDWVACYTIAYCKKNGIDEFVTQSSGNTANALSKYCNQHCVKVNIFYLKENEEKINQEYIGSGEYVILHEVIGKESRMKELTFEFSKKNRIPWLPDLTLQVISNSLRADIAKHVSDEYKIRFDWMSQALSSGFGVFGFYDGLRRKKISTSEGYSLIGIQQSAVCPFVKRFAPHLILNPKLTMEMPIEKALFRSTPTEELYILMEKVVIEFGAEFSLITNDLYKNLSPIACELLNNSGIKLTVDAKGFHHEKSGILSLVGVIDLINNNIVKNGQSVLVAFTGGCGSVPRGNIVPNFVHE